MTPHLRGNVRAYVDRALPAALLHVYDRHLVCCQMCRAAADQERRIVASLRADTFVPGSLLTSLMGVATLPLPEVERSTERTTPKRPAAPRIPLGPLAPIAARSPFPSRAAAEAYPFLRQPVPTVAPTAPAMHRSPMRAAVVASLAAGASMAAAWGLAVTPLPGGTRTATAGEPAGVTSALPSFVTPAEYATVGVLPNASSGVSAQAWLVSAVGSRALAAAQTVRQGISATPRLSLPVAPAPVRISFVLSAESRS